MSSAGHSGKRKGSESRLKQTSMGDFFSKPRGTDKKKKRKHMQKMSSFIWTRGSYLDTEEYRNNYPGKRDNPNWNDNYDFYMNHIPSKPDGDFIDRIHSLWWGDHSRLERHHGYIQWLFPIRDSGMNWHAQELQLHEIEGLKKEKKAMKRLLKSYEMMLEFYGMKLADQTDGTIERGGNWRDRFRHLNRSYHNYLRITRILKCLGEFEYEHLKANFVKFVLYEGLVKNTLPNTIDSCMKYWVGVIRSEEEREDILNYYDKLCENEDREEDEESEEEEVKMPIPRKDKKEKASTVPVAKTSKSQGSDSDMSEDETLPYAMSLIDSDNENETSKKARKTHEMSESDEEFQTPNTDDSQELQYWKTDKSPAENSLQDGSDAVEDNTDTLDNDSNITGDNAVEQERSENDNNDTLGRAGNNMQQDNSGENMDEGSSGNQNQNADIGTDNINSKESETNDGIVKSTEHEVPVASTENTAAGDQLQNSGTENKESNVKEKGEKVTAEKLKEYNHEVEDHHKENSDSRDGVPENEKNGGNDTEGKKNGKEDMSGAAMEIPENQSTKDDNQGNVQQQKRVNIKPDGTEAEEEMEVDNDDRSTDL